MIFLATPPVTERIPKGVLITLEEGKVQNMKKGNISPVIKLVKY